LIVMRQKPPKSIATRNDSIGREGLPDPSEDPRDPHRSHPMRYTDGDTPGTCNLCALSDTSPAIESPCQYKRPTGARVSLADFVAELRAMADTFAQAWTFGNEPRALDEWHAEFYEWIRIKRRKK
jgi:hypothetical protein